MNKQLATLLATLTLLVSTGGCSGMRNFLFGRGAACGGACASAAPVYGIAEPSCGYEPTCGYEVAPRRGCGLLNGQSTCSAGPSCGCGGGSAQTYMPSDIDTYQGEVHDPYSHGGEVIGSQVMGDSYNGYPSSGYPSNGYPSNGYPIQGSIPSGNMVPSSVYPNGGVQDNFDARGNRIIGGNTIPGTVMQP